MKRSFLLFAVLSALLLFVDYSNNAADAQGRREQRRERRQWRRTARTYVRNPLALKAREEGFAEQVRQLTEKNNELTQRYTELQAQLDNAEAQLRRCNSRVDSALGAAERSRSELQACRDAANSQQGAAGAGNADITQMRGLVYRVQIGAYERFDMTRYNAEGGSFSGETYDNLNKYLIGRFRSYDNAKAFRDDIRRLGIRDAFVVAYNDGTRIEIQDAQRLERGSAPAGR